MYFFACDLKMFNTSSDLEGWVCLVFVRYRFTALAGYGRHTREEDPEPLVVSASWVLCFPNSLVDLVPSSLPEEAAVMNSTALQVNEQIRVNM